MITDIHLANVENRQIEVAGEVVSYENVLSAIAAESFCYPDALANCTQHLLEVLVLSIIILAVNSVV